MIYVQFYIRFNQQFRRTKPDLLAYLDKNLVEAAHNAGGRVESGRLATSGKGIMVLLDEQKIGFSLNMVIFLEKTYRILNKAASELLGYAIVLGRNIDEVSSPKLCLSFSVKTEKDNTGIWYSKEIKNDLDFYTSNTESENSYYLVKSFNTYDIDKREKSREIIASNMENRRSHFNLFQVKAEEAFLMDVKYGLYSYVCDFLKDIPPLVIRLEAGSPICFIDAYSKGIKTFIRNSLGSEIEQKLDEIYNIISMERLRDEWSIYINEQSRNFFTLLLAVYTDAVNSHNANGVLIMDGLHKTSGDSARLFKTSIINLESNIYVCAYSSGESVAVWKEMFTRILNYSDKASDAFSSRALRERKITEKLPLDIWELAYNIMLLSKYFPVHTLSELFNEEGLNSELYYRAVEILSSYDIAIPSDPRPEIDESIIENLLGQRKEKIRRAVRDLILTRLPEGKLRPCFNLLKILDSLGVKADNELALRSLKSDVLNGTWQGIEESLSKGYFSSLVDEQNTAAMKYIFNTLRALVWGGSETDDIEKAFHDAIPAMTCYEGCQVQVHLNLASYYLGSGNSDTASEEIRKAMHINRSLGNNGIPAFRFFSLANLSKQKIDDALEYIGFALEQAENSRQHEELFLSCYYGACINFIYGNFSKAGRLIRKAEETAISLGSKDWYNRAAFFKGRIFFENGQYKEALDTFQSIETSLSYPRPPHFMAITKTVHAWIYRTKNFMNHFTCIPTEEENESLDSLDGKIFEIEASYYKGDYQRAASLSDNFISSPDAVKGNFLFTEQPDWRSGYSQCEYLLQPDKIPGTRLAWVYRLMAQCALQQERDGKAVTLNNMQRFMRDELLPETDPFDSYYFNAWHSMLNDLINDSKEPSSLDKTQSEMENMLSIAIRRLRRRRDRIDDRETMMNYFSSSFWNRNLYLAGKEFRVI